MTKKILVVLIGLSGCISAPPGSNINYSSPYNMDTDYGMRRERYPAPEYWNRYPGWNRYLDRDADLDAPMPLRSGTSPAGTIFQPSIIMPDRDPVVGTQLPAPGDRYPQGNAQSSVLVVPERSVRTPPTQSMGSDKIQSDARRLDELKAKLTKGSNSEKHETISVPMTPADTTANQSDHVSKAPEPNTTPTPPNGSVARTRSGLLIYAPPETKPDPAKPAETEGSAVKPTPVAPLTSLPSNKPTDKQIEKSTDNPTSL